MSWNVNGIRSVYRKGFLDSLQKMNPDVLCLQEIKANREDINFKIDGYFAFWSPSKRKGYSGVGILSKQEPIAIDNCSEMKEFGEDGRILMACFPKFTLLNVYFPHGGRKKEQMPFKLRMYESFLTHLRKLEGTVVLCGDFNVAHTELDLARPANNKNNTMFTSEERKQVDALINERFVDTFRYLNPQEKKYTWWPYYRNARERNLGWRIDYAFISERSVGEVKDAFILTEIRGSDHCPIGIDLSLPLL